MSNPATPTKFAYERDDEAPSSSGSEIVGCADELNESPAASPVKAYAAHVVARPAAPAEPAAETAAERVQRLVQQMKDKALQERIKQAQQAAEQQRLDEEAELLPSVPSSTNTSMFMSTSAVMATLPPLSSFAAASTSSDAKPWRANKITAAAAVVPVDAGAAEANPNVISIAASEFRDDDWSEIERRRARSNLFRAKSPSAVRRILDRPPVLPKRQPRESTVPEPFSFYSETASFEQLANFHPPAPMFKASEYHAEHAHELEMVRQQGKNRYVAPKPLTVPESPALKTRERSELHQERHGDDVSAAVGGDYDDDGGDHELPRTISFDRVATRDMPQRATFKPQLTIPESPGLQTNERGEARREQALAREEAERAREEAERAEQSERVQRALANHKQQHAAPQRRELTVPESPAFLTRDRANIRRELLDSIRERQDVFDESVAAAAYDDHKDAVRAVSFDQFLGGHERTAPQPRHSFKQELTVPESPAFLTRDRAQARRQLQERLDVSGDAADEDDDESLDLDGVPTPPLSQLRSMPAARAKPALTVPESPFFATTDRNDARRELQREAAERAAEHAAELARVERDVRDRRERLAARHYVAQRRALTVPESPALLTKMRGEVHAERFEALVQEEEARADQIEADARLPLRRIDSQNRAAAAAPVARKQKSLTIPESPALLTKMRNDAAHDIENQ